MKTLTVFTPTYNRAYTLNKCYDSLKKQACKDFKWLIIDDGSTDNTRELIEEWMSENIIDITYFYQENQGMHGAHNTAYELIDTELNVCIDSDDYMPEDAVEKIINYWNKVRADDIAGIIALDAKEDGTVVGDRLPEKINRVKLFDLHYKYKIKGDKKLVYRTELTQKYPYPIFKGEKYVSLSYKYTKLDEDYDLAILNEILCIVEYMEDGSSKNMLKQYRRNPKGFAFLRIHNLNNPRAKFLFKYKESIHYVSCSMLSRNKSFLKETPNKLLTLSAIPLGIILYFYVLRNTKEIKI